MSEIWGIPSSYKSGAKNHLFRRLRNVTGSTATLTAYICGTKRDTDNRLSALTTTRGILRCPKMSLTLVLKRLQIGPPFYPPCVNSAFYSIAMLRRRSPGRLKMRKWKTRNREKYRGGKGRTGKRPTKFDRVQKAGPPSMEREMDKYKCIMYR